MEKGKKQRKIFEKIALAQPICFELSLLDIYYLCKGLSLWLDKFPRTQFTRKLFLKLRTNLTVKFPHLTEDIHYLLPEKKD